MAYKHVQSCSALCNLVDYSQPGYSFHEIFPVKMLEWVAISFSRGSSQSRELISCVSCIAGRFFTAELLGNPMAIVDRNKNVWSQEGLVSS